MPSDPVYQELFNAKKYQYNSEHNIKIGGADVELYVQPADQPHHSQGIYSVKNNQWISVPRRRRAKIDDACVRDKVADLDARIHDAVKHGDENAISTLWQKIKQMRQTGLDQQGEFGCENIAFKMLRNNGCIKMLKDALTAAQDRKFSMDEARKKKSKKKVKYGYGGYWFPGYNFADSGSEGGGDGGGGESRYMESPDGVNPSTKSILEEPVDESPDGVNPSTAMFLTEDDIDIVLSRFFDNCIDFLGIENAPEMVLHHNTDWSESTGSFGQFDPDNNLLHLATSGRHVLDILRTMAHELTHCRQNELQTLPDNAGETGSRWEDQANAMAGRIMRHWADKHPEMFRDVSLEESASGYIPRNKKQARDPRYSMALTVDIKPGQVGREANKLALDTDSQGKPALLMKTVNLREDRMPQPSQGPGRYRELNQPLGPESPPTMPAGTVRVDVSDVYDWYKLGQHISNMKGLGKHDFGKGPPSAIISFGDEETEHKYIKDLEKTGLTTTDIDPVDVNQPPGMPRQKTDPTYNVDEEDDLVESLRREFELLENEILGEINMSPSNLRTEAAKTGALAGMEFEMIVPDTDSDAYNDNMEPDMDSNESVIRIQDAYDFFYDGEYNGRREVGRLRERMENDFEDWASDRLAEDWEENQFEYVYQYLIDNAGAEEIAEILGLDPETIDIISKQQAQEAALKVVEEQLNPYYVEAQDTAREDFYQDGDREQEWLESEDLNMMSDIMSRYDITWPHWQTTGSGGGDISIDSVANDFSTAISRPVNTSQRYSMGLREPGKYVVEPDGSLDPDNDNDLGLEFVSPPLPIDEMLSDLNKVRIWAKTVDAYTNDSTGLHINISVPNFDPAKLDYVKLALLLGDKYVLDQFGRSSNTYTQSALGKVEKMVRQNPQTAQALLDKMRGHMEDLATKAVHSGETEKYTSINTKSNRIEFRSPGGDWLNENLDKIENTLLRFTVALSAAMDPEAYREEYLKKLYKLLSPTADTNRNKDTVKYFADYVAGNLPKAALRSFVKQAQLERGVAKGRVTGPMWWEVINPAMPQASINVVAGNAEEAIASAILPGNYPEWAKVQNTLKATPLRPYTSPAAKTAAQAQQQATPASQNTGDPGSLIDQGLAASGNFTGNWLIQDPEGRTLHRFGGVGNSQGDANNFALRWLRSNPQHIYTGVEVVPELR
jgi:hypothetical protein